MNRNIEESRIAVLEFISEITTNKNTMKSYRDRINMIANYCQSKKITEFDVISAGEYIKHQEDRSERGEISKKWVTGLRKAAEMLADYAQGKELKWTHRVYGQRNPCIENYESLLSKFNVSIIPTLAPGTIKTVMIISRQFLSFLEDNQIYDIKQFTIYDARKFVIESIPKRKGSMNNLVCYLKKFISFLRHLGQTSVDESILFNPVPGRTRALPCFTQEETEGLLSAVDTSTAMGKRDYAVMKIALGTGLRGKDIFDLCMKDIDWQKNEIYVIQGKTGGHIQLPLLPDVGNAVADYILNGRPKSNSPRIFLRHRSPYEPLGNVGSGAQIIARYAAKAGIFRNIGDGKTFHAFRRTAGTRLIVAETPLPSVAQILGHRNIDSTKRYIAMDVNMMRLCCMDISMYATSKEGLL